MGLLLTIGSWITGGGLGSITREIRGMRKDALDAKNETQRVKLEKDMALLETKRDVLIAEARSNWNIIFRGFLALPFGLFVWKVIVWDKLLKFGVTDDLSPEMWKLLAVVYGFYFVYETAALFKRR